MSSSPLEFEPPATTDELRAAINSLHEDIHAVHELLGKLVESHNQVGQNVAWLVANTQGLFQMFSDPNVINQMMGTMMGGMANGGLTSPGTDTK